MKSYTKLKQEAGGGGGRASTAVPTPTEVTGEATEGSALAPYPLPCLLSIATCILVAREPDSQTRSYKLRLQRLGHQTGEHLRSYTPVVLYYIGKTAACKALY